MAGPADGDQSVTPTGLPEWVRWLVDHPRPRPTSRTLPAVSVSSAAPRSWTCQYSALPFFGKLKRCASGRDRLIRLALPGTDRVLILPCSPRWPTGWSCACSTAGIAARRGLSSPRWMASSGTATCQVSARASTGARPVRAGPRPAVQRGEAAARPVRHGREGPAPLARGLVLPSVRRARCHQHSRQCPLYATQCRYQSVFRLGR